LQLPGVLELDFGYGPAMPRALVTGYWLLVTGYWLLVIGYWLLLTIHHLPFTVHWL